MQILFVFITALLHAQFQIRTFNTLRQHFGGGDMEQIQHIFPNLRRCRCGEERDDVRLERVHRIAEGQISGPEIAAPLRDTVRLVNHK